MRKRFEFPRHKYFFFLANVALIASLTPLARAQGFPPISQEELKMTSEPQASGAPAIILFREVDCDDNGITSHEDHYMRIKVLTEAGRQQGNIEIAFSKASQEIINVHARTVQPDGRVVDFNDKIMETTVRKVHGLSYVAKTFTLPDVQVGSIIEYRYTVDLREHLFFDSHWIVSSNLFTKEAKFSLKPYKAAYRPLTLRWTSQGLPPDSEAKEGPDHVVRLEVRNIPAFEMEDYMPPPNQLKARVDFVYEGEFMESDPDQFWRHVGKAKNEALENFVGKRKAMEEAVAQIVSPADPPEVKLRKIYERVQKLRNTSYEIRKSAEEEKRDKEKPAENVEDVWKHGYGNYTQLNWLFLALARAAGFDAHGVWVSNRRDYFFNPKSMENRKLSFCIVLVKLDGKDLYFEPGAAFASFGMLTWSLTGTPGLSIDKDGGTWIKTPLPQSSDSRIEHSAKFTLDENGDLRGTVTMTYTGLEAMYHRQDVRNSDDVTRRRFLEVRIKDQVPMAANVELINEPDWTNPETPLVAEFKVTIPGWATAAGKRELISVGVFAAGEKRLFERENRVHPIYIAYPHQKIDDVTIELPTGWQIASVPPLQSQDGHVVSYSMQAENDHTTLHLKRKLTWDFLFLDQKYYTSLRNFFQTVRTGDDQQIVLLRPAAQATN